MTDELTKTFFDTFDIEPRKFKSCDVGTFCPYPEKECGTDTCPYYRTYKVDYPAISDRILLELICILLSNNSPYMFKLGNWDVEKLKDTVLTMCIKLPDFLEWEDTSEYFKHQVRTLFEEG